MDAQALSLIRAMCGRIDDHVPRQGREQADYARALFEHLDKPGGGVESVDEPWIAKTPIADLGNWSNDPWEGPSYAIDASTTQALEYTNGLIMDTAYAKLGVGGIGVDRSAERAGTVKTVVYYDEGESSIRGEEFSAEDSPVQGELVTYDAGGDSTQNLSKAVSSVAQSLAEGEHARRMLSEVDGPLFLDGSLYPLGVLYWVLLDNAGVTSPAASWDVPRKIVENYIDVVETQYDRGFPVVGVVKTSTTSQLVDSLEEKIRQHGVVDENGLRPDVSWTRDHQYIAEVLQGGTLNDLTYTSWFVSTELAAGRLGDTEILEPFAADLEFGEPGDYRRAFFYVRLPKQGFVFRVETPLLFVLDDEETRDEIQNKALKEIAKRRDVPQAVKRADRIAGISQGNRQTIRGVLESSAPTQNYNWDGRWSQDDLSGMEPDDE